MPIEIGSLVVHGSFGTSPQPRETAPGPTQDQLHEWRALILEEVEELVAERLRRMEER